MLRTLIRKVGYILVGISNYEKNGNKLPASWEQYKDYIKVHPSAIIDKSSVLQIFNPPLYKKVCLEIGADSHIFSSFSILHPEACIKVGERCQLGNSSFISAESIEVGNDVLMSWGVTVFDSDAHSFNHHDRRKDIRLLYEEHSQNDSSKYSLKDWSCVKRKKIVIKNDAWIGFNASILKGAVIGEKSIIGACSVVTKSVPDNSVVFGNPCKIIKKKSN